jgi:hypothetical protein
MSNPKFQANVTFELASKTRRWAVYKVTDADRGHVGFFRIDQESGYCDDRDESGVLQLGPCFSGHLTTEQFADRFEFLNWVYDVLGEFLGRGELPVYEFIST